MRFGTFIALALALLPLGARADEKLPVLRAGNITYSNITVSTVSATDVYFTYSGGMGNVKLKDLSPDLQQHFKYDPDKAREAEQKQAENKAKYHEQLLHQPAAQPPDTSLDADAPATNGAAWEHKMSELLAQAGAEHKFVLLDFTSSDASDASTKFDQEVLGTPKFIEYCTRKLKFVKVDFLDHTPQPEGLKRTDAALAERYQLKIIPTCVLLDPSGKELGRQVGYAPGGSDPFIAELESFIHK
ncbi:MAG TPA: thioredoxin family protein [Candidatus Acidoferrales bacterium]|jgi:hypothetical protein|nr:thioredoxin family protein [Candidatus Acidoferrales bacterium]